MLIGMKEDGYIKQKELKELTNKIYEVIRR